MTLIPTILHFGFLTSSAIARVSGHYDPAPPWRVRLLHSERSELSPIRTVDVHDEKFGRFFSRKVIGRGMSFAIPQTIVEDGSEFLGVKNIAGRGARSGFPGPIQAHNREVTAA